MGPVRCETNLTEFLDLHNILSQARSVVLVMLALWVHLNITVLVPSLVDNTKILKIKIIKCYLYNITTSPSSHQIYFGEAIQQDKRKVFRDASDSRKIVIKYYFVIYLITNYIQIIMLSCNIYNILQIIERKNLACRIVWTYETYGTSFRINFGF
jgi:hypothetical protein